MEAAVIGERWYLFWGGQHPKSRIWAFGALHPTFAFFQSAVPTAALSAVLVCSVQEVFGHNSMLCQVNVALQ